MTLTRDSAVINFLKRHHGGIVKAARALGLESHQTLANWAKRGIAPDYRPIVWDHCNRHGFPLSQEWLIKSAQKHQQRKAGTNGRARKSKSTAQGRPGQAGKGKRKPAGSTGRPARPQQRRSAARGLRPLAAQG